MAEDYTLKRRAMAKLAVGHTTSLVNAIRGLKGLGEDLREVDGGFQDADFDPNPTTGEPDLSHLNAWKLDTLLTAVIPALDAAADTSIGGDGGPTARSILLAVKRAS